MLTLLSMDEVDRRRYEEPFRRERKPADDMQVIANRIAFALEYMAFQLGEINRKLDIIVGRDDEPPADDC